jgi:hypothetical protein
MGLLCNRDGSVDGFHNTRSDPLNFSMVSTSEGGGRLGCPVEETGEEVDSDAAKG